jgi:hypothetical protein
MAAGATLSPLVTTPTTEVLLSTNLVSGVVDARR